MIGTALEELTKATGAVAHLYKKFEMGPNPGQSRVKTQEFDPLFEGIIRETGVVSVGGNRAAAASGAEEEKKAEPAGQAEESKTAQPAAAEAPKGDDALILARMAGEFPQLEMLTIVMGNFQQVRMFKARCQKVLKAELPNQG